MTAVTPDETTAFPAAGLERRFYAFAIDRVIAWTLFAAAGVGAWALFFRHGEVLPGVLLIVGVVLLVSLIFAVLLGAAGRSPGKAAMGLRLVHHGTGTPPGVGPALLRTLVLGVATIPTLGLGLATLAWTAMMDPSRMRRGWHDHVSKAVVVDMRPRQVAEEATDSQPRHVVNLTAMRLVPAAPRRDRDTSAVAAHADARAQAPVRTGAGRADPTGAAPRTSGTPASPASTSAGAGPGALRADVLRADAIRADAIRAGSTTRARQRAHRRTQWCPGAAARHGHGAGVTMAGDLRRRTVLHRGGPGHHRTPSRGTPR
jgi:uncharacterized RDD family membrane protein YckC